MRFAELKKHGSASDFHDLKQYAAIMTEMKKVMQTLTDLIKELKKNKAQLLLQNAEEAVSDLVMTLDTLRKRATLLACRGIINDVDGFDLAALRSANDLVVIEDKEFKQRWTTHDNLLGTIASIVKVAVKTSKVADNDHDSLEAALEPIIDVEEAVKKKKDVCTMLQYIGASQEDQSALESGVQHAEAMLKRVVEEAWSRLAATFKLLAFKKGKHNNSQLAQSTCKTVAMSSLDPDDTAPVRDLQGMATLYQESHSSKPF